MSAGCRAARGRRREVPTGRGNSSVGPGAPLAFSRYRIRCRCRRKPKIRARVCEGPWGARQPPAPPLLPVHGGPPSLAATSPKTSACRTSAQRGTVALCVFSSASPVRAHGDGSSSDTPSPLTLLLTSPGTPTTVLRTQ